MSVITALPDTERSALAGRNSIREFVTSKNPGFIPEITWEPMSRTEFLALPDSEYRLEWADGWAILMPPELTSNIGALMELVLIFKQSFPDFGVYHEAGLLISPSGNLRQPDLSIYPYRVSDQYWVVDKPLIAIEALSKSTRRQDLVTKRIEYGQMGISQYWLVDVPQKRITILHNIGGEYRVAYVLDSEHKVLDVEIGTHGSLKLDISKIMP